MRQPIRKGFGRHSHSHSYCSPYVRSSCTDLWNRLQTCGTNSTFGAKPAEGYAAGKDRAYFEVVASLGGPPRAGECACQPCQVKRACLRKVMVLLARSSPALFELVEAWALEDNDSRI